MKNKIKNTEMEYIAKAKCDVDSSFPTDGFRRVTEITWAVFILFFSMCPESLLIFGSVFL